MTVILFFFFFFLNADTKFASDFANIINAGNRHRLWMSVLLNVLYSIFFLCVILTWISRSSSCFLLRISISCFCCSGDISKINKNKKKILKREIEAKNKFYALKFVDLRNGWINNAYVRYGIFFFFVGCCCLKCYESSRLISVDSSICQNMSLIISLTVQYIIDFLPLKF